MVVHCLIATRPHHQRYSAFLDRLRPEGQTEIYLSSISWLEFAHVSCQQSFLEGLADEHGQRYELARWQERQIREQSVGGMLATARDLRSAFEVTELPITSDVQAAVLDLIPRSRLAAQDACYVAVATSTGVVDLASLDEGFRRVDGLRSGTTSSRGGIPSQPTRRSRA